MVEFNFILCTFQFSKFSYKICINFINRKSSLTSNSKSLREGIIAVKQKVVFLSENTHMHASTQYIRMHVGARTTHTHTRTCVHTFSFSMEEVEIYLLAVYGIWADSALHSQVLQVSDLHLALEHRLKRFDIRLKLMLFKYAFNSTQV